jgi:hypothetical protein
LIIASLSVIESLINSNSPMALKVQTVGSENFHNSIRVALVRGEQSTLPNSLVRVMNELMSETIDLSSATNSEIIRKCVGIFKSLADFIVVEKKKVKSKSNDKEGDE